MDAPQGDGLLTGRRAQFSHE